MQGDKVIDMKEAVDKQNKAMEEMLITLNEISTKMDGIKADNDKQPEEITVVSKTIKEESISNIQVFEKLTAEDSKIDEELEHQKVINFSAPRLSRMFRHPLPTPCFRML